MPQPILNLPPIEARVKKGSTGRNLIFDSQRRRYVTLTAEEWVRQHFVSYLINHLGYPSALVGNEVGVTVGGVKRRCDSVVFSPKDGSPLIIIEYKAPTITITQEVFTQIQSYNSVLRAEYLIVTNGKHHFCCHIDYENRTASFLENIPTWEMVNKRA